MAAAVADKKGLKRICMSCGTRFYDLNKRPVVCPHCSTEFTGESKIKGRRGRAAANDEPVAGKPAEEAAAPAEAHEVEAGDEMVVSLEEVDEGKDADDDDELGMEIDDEELGDLEDLEEDASLEAELETKGKEGDAAEESGKKPKGKKKK